MALGNWKGFVGRFESFTTDQVSNPLCIAVVFVPPRAINGAHADPVELVMGNDIFS